MDAHTMRRYTIASLAATLGGAAAAAGSIALLVRDAWSGGFTVEICLMPVLVGLTILTGLMAGRAVRRGRVISAAGLLLLAMFGSGLVVYEQAGRRAELRDLKVASADSNSVQRQIDLKKLREAEEILTKHRAARDAECSGGKGKVCDGKQYTVDTWEAAVKGYKVELAKQPPVPVDPRAERIAALLKVFGVRVEDATVKTIVAIFEPIALPLFLEGCSILLLGYGLSPVARGRVARVSGKRTPLVPVEAPRPPQGGGRRGRKADPKVVDFVRAFRERHGCAPSGSAVKAAFPELPTSTAYDYARRA